jgi:amino acid adenylation domain-containing protein
VEISGRGRKQETVERGAEKMGHEEKRTEWAADGAIAVAEEVEGFRLSPQQRRVWRLQQEVNTNVYRAQCAVEIEGALDLVSLKEAIQSVVRQNEILRTTFHRVSGASLPLQVIGESVELPVEEYDLSEMETQEQESRIEALFRQAGESGFDFGSSPLARVSLVRLASESHQLLITLPALCGDKLGLQNFVNGIGNAYAARVQEGHELEGEPMQYADLSEVLNELLEADDTEKGRDYWQQQNLTALVNLRLFSEKQSPASTPFDFQAFSLQLSGDETTRIEEVARERAVSSPVFLLACWYILIRRLSEQSDILVGVAHDGRTYSGLEDALGLFAKYLPVSCSINLDEQFGNVLRRVSEAVAVASEWQEYFAWEESGDNTGNTAELFAPFAFDYEVVSGERRAANLTLNLKRQETCIERFKIKALLVEQEGALCVELHYDPAYFAEEDMAYLAQRFRTLISSAVADANAPVSDLEILGEEERSTLLSDLNQTKVPYRNDVCLHQLFEEQVAKTPDRIAVVFDEEKLSYNELNERANRLARRLHAAGVRADARVAILMERSVEMVVALLAVLKAGGAYVPLDPQYPQERLAFMLEDAGAPVLLTHGELAEGLPTGNAHVIRLDADRNEMSDSGDDENLSISVSPQNLAYVIYTSGSTGQPKGVMLTHSSICNHMLWMNESFPLTADDSVLQKTPFSFDASVWEFYAPLMSGARLVIARPGGHQDPAYLIKLIAEQEVSTLQVVPTLLRALVETAGLESCRKLRRLFCGGEALTSEPVARLKERLPEVEVYNLYGPTEATIDATFWRCVEESPAGLSEPIGRPVANTRVYVADERTRLVPYGSSGELLIGGVALARGYLSRAELTAERFVPDPFSGEAGQRLYRTGDLVRYLPDGQLEYLGRIDHQVKVRGYRIELGEIESALCAHAAVREAAVTARSEASGEKRLAGYVVPHEGSAVTTKELREHMLERLPDYMVPQSFVLLKSLPLTPSGKVDRRALPALESVSADSSEAFIAPRNPLEEVLANIWSEVLAVRQLSVNDNFFELGGHSLLATQLISRVRETFAVELPLRQIFETPTVAGLAASLESRIFGDERLKAPPVVPVSREQPLPLSFAQQRLWFLDQLEPQSALYNIPAALRLTGSLNVAALEQTISEVVRRHEVLRTTFAEVDGEPVQIIRESAPVNLTVVKLEEMGEGEREEEVRRLSLEETEKPFDLCSGPLLRVSLLKLTDDEHVLLFTVHHIASDGWSMGVLVREVAALYAAYVNGERSPLAELPVQYADFAMWQQQWLQGEALEQQLSYWREQLQDASPVLELPTDKVRPALQSNRGGHEPFVLGVELSERLKALSRSEGATLFMTLLAAFQALLSRYSGQQEIVVGTPIANRNRQETEDLVGFFINTLVLRGDMTDDPSFRQFLARVREVCLGAYMHQDVPFERLVEELQPERDLSRTPLFQAFFVLQNLPSRTLDLPGLSLSPVEMDIRKVLFDLTLDMREDGSNIVGIFEYSTDLFEAATIRRMISHFTTLLEGVVSNPEQKLSKLPLLTEDERRTLCEWNPAAWEQPSGRCLHELFEEQAAATPDAMAVVFNGEQLTYSELNRRANQLAHRLSAMGVGPEVMVGLCLERSIQMVVGLLGILKAGGAYLPLDPTYPMDRLAFMLEDSDARVLLTQERLRDALPPMDAQVFDIGCSSVAIESMENPRVALANENLAYMIYTSGSTGRPKGVMVTHRAASSNSAAISTRYRLTTSDRVLQFASLSFDVAVEELFPTWHSGAGVVLRSASALDSPSAFHSFLEEQGVTTVNLPTAYWQELMTDWERRGVGAPKGLRLAAIGGEKGLWEQFARSRSVIGAGVELLNVYGPTETTVTNTSFDYAEAATERAGYGWSVPIGRPLSNSRLYVLDENREPVPVGVPGELYIGGECLARGYFERPELTAEKFIPDQFSGDEGARLYRTGDVVRWVEGGAVEFVGRVDHQVKIRGFRVELGEVEAALNSEPGVSDSMVVMREDVVGDQRLVAYVVAEQGERVEASQLRAALKESLPGYMVPQLFVVLEEWPLTPNGKVDRRALPVPEQGKGAPGEEYVAPQSAVEEVIAGIWCEVLKVERVGLADDFFELGGHSLLATQVVSRVREALQVEVALRSLFEKSSLADFAALVEEGLLEKLEDMTDEEAELLLNEAF